MSNVPGSMPLSSVIDPVCDFNHKPSYMVQKSAVENAYFQVVTLSNYSDSLLNFKLQMSNADSQIADKVILMEVPIRFNITGSRASGLPLLQDGQFGVRSNAITKAINNCQLSVASTAQISQPSDNGIITSAFEQSAPMGWRKHFETVDSVAFDSCSNYDDMVGGLRNVLSLYRNGSGSYLGRAAYDITVESNTAVAASLLVKFSFCVFLSPLLSTFSVQGPSSPAFSHIDNLVLNLQLQSLATRTLAFCRDALSDRLSITNIQALIGPNSGVAPPVATFTTYNLTDMSVVPPVDNMPLQILDRYSLQFNQAPADGFRVVSGPSITLDTVPSYVLIFASHPMSNYTSQALVLNDASVCHGSQLTDTFCAINQVNLQVAGVNMLNQSNSNTLYKMCVENGSELPYPSFAGTPLLNSVSPTLTYTTGVGSVIKLNFDTNIKVMAGGQQVSPGTNYKFLFQANVSVKNIYRLTNNQLSLYYVFVYPSVLQVRGVNESKLIQSPLTLSDVANAHQQVATTHYQHIVNHDLQGWGLAGRMHKLITKHSASRNTKRGRMITKHIKDAIANVSGSGYTGGRMLSGSRSGSRKGSRKSSLRFQ